MEGEGHSGAGKGQLSAPAYEPPLINPDYRGCPPPPTQLPNYLLNPICLSPPPNLHRSSAYL